MSARTIQVVLSFSEDELNAILKSVYSGAGKAPTVADLTDEQFEQLTREMQTTDYKTEIIEGASEAAANDWLADLMDQFE